MWLLRAQRDGKEILAVAKSRASTNSRSLSRTSRHGRGRTRSEAFRRQKQRVSIARGFWRPRILILDEATPARFRVRRLIQEGLRYLMQGRTTFVIAHRLSTIRRADQILVVEAGRIIERGTHDRLCARRPLLRPLYAAARRWKQPVPGRPGKARSKATTQTPPKWRRLRMARDAADPRRPSASFAPIQLGSLREYSFGETCGSQ